MILEEGIRAGAVLIGLIFLVVPIAVSLGVRSSWILIVPLLGGIVSFALGMWLRTRTGMQPLSITRRGWLVGLASALGAFLVLGVTQLVLEAISLGRFAVELLVVLAVLGYFAWRPPKGLIR